MTVSWPGWILSPCSMRRPGAWMGSSAWTGRSHRFLAGFAERGGTDLDSVNALGVAEYAGLPSAEVLARWPVTPRGNGLSARRSASGPRPGRCGLHARAPAWSRCRPRPAGGRTRSTSRRRSREGSAMRWRACAAARGSRRWAARSPGRRERRRAPGRPADGRSCGPHCAGIADRPGAASPPCVRSTRPRSSPSAPAGPCRAPRTSATPGTSHSTSGSRPGLPPGSTGSTG
jgi:hypothetical protein